MKCDTPLRSTLILYDYLMKF